MIVRFVDDRMRSRVAGMRLAVSFGASSLAVWLLGPLVKGAGSRAAVDHGGDRDDDLRGGHAAADATCRSTTAGLDESTFRARTAVLACAARRDEGWRPKAQAAVA